MTALAENISRSHRAAERMVLPVAAGAKIYQGSLVEITTAGHIQAHGKAADKNIIAVAEVSADNTGGAAGAISCSVVRNRAFLFAAAATVTAGEAVYALDDNTVTDVATKATKIGLCLSKDSRGAWVEVGYHTG